SQRRRPPAVPSRRRRGVDLPARRGLDRARRSRRRRPAWGNRPSVGRRVQAVRAHGLDTQGDARGGAPADDRFLSPAPRVTPIVVLMSGHSKWHSIKHKKAVVDQRRGQQFTKLARAVTVAAREGGGDPEGNSALALAIQKARDASMPKDNIERAIAKGTGDGSDADQIETVVYEGDGPGGVALLIEALTDNRNRTSADIRHAFSKHGGSLGEPGSVAYLFDKSGVIVVDASHYDEDDLLVAVTQALRDAGIETESADVTQRPKARVEVSEADAGRLLKLIDMLEESDDVSAVDANFDVDASVLERI